MSHISREKPDLLGTEQHADCIPVDDVGIVPLELEPVPLASARLGLGLGVLACALELDTDERFVADDPRFVTGRDQIGLARADLEFGAVVVSNVNVPRDGVAQMLDLAAVGPHHRLDALRPLPPRLEGEA